jgi:hypothetical protein
MRRGAFQAEINAIVRIENRRTGAQQTSSRPKAGGKAYR